MSYSIQYRVNFGRYEPWTRTLTGCTDLSYDQNGSWISFKRGGKIVMIPSCNVIYVIQE